MAVLRDEGDMLCEPAEVKVSHILGCCGVWCVTP